MKIYETAKIAITVFQENDVLTTSNPGNYEGVSDLDPTARPDWFSK